MTIRLVTDKDEWDQAVLDLAGHPLQMWGWGELKSKHNWRAERLLVEDDDGLVGGAQLLVRRLPKPFGAIVYVPRGPFYRFGMENEVYREIIDYSKQNFKAVCLTVEPDSETAPMGGGWRFTDNTILLAETLILDLTKTEDELLATMSKKTRQYIRKSSKESIEIKQVKDEETISKCLDVYHETAERAQFGLHDDQYYLDVAQDLGDSSVLMAAVENGEVVAFLWLAISGQTAFELYGGVTDRGQQLRANYALKWSAITKCKGWGIERYNLNGLVSDGVSNFKRGFANHEDRLAGTYDYPLSPLYSIWSKVLPSGKKLIRKLKLLRK